MARLGPFLLRDLNSNLGPEVSNFEYNFTVPLEFLRLKLAYILYKDQIHTVSHKEHNTLPLQRPISEKE
jgi:hypothetical protein